ncbi:uncharacterized protein LOC141677589 [Apium graveolens]|uniref:uncharacterized protein LOC141677589 n=1 Tax=Apium graveolens TaxID=4045 RepID=UPI003D7BE32D
MSIALSSKLKYGFVDGTCAKPAQNAPLLMHWMRCNDMVTSWLLNSVSVDIRNSMVYIITARDIWLDLEVRYAQSNVPKLFNLRKELSHLEQGSLSLSGYFTRFRTINDELDSVVNKPRYICAQCTCQVNAKLIESEQNVQLTHFLMGLNDTYTAIRGQILLMKPLPTLNQSYAILLQEENQRNIHNAVSVTNDNVAMSVKTQSNPFKPQARFQVNKKGSDATIICEFCHMSGHLKEKCYCIHGYPSWHRLFGKPKPKPKNLTPRNSVVATVVHSPDDVITAHTITTNTSISAGVQYSNSSPPLNLSDLQCHQLIKMLQQSLSGNQSNIASVPFNDGPSWNSNHSVNTVQMTGPYMEDTSRTW